jgi:hypothetical protein
VNGGVDALGPVAPWVAAVILTAGALAGVLKVATDFYRARTEDRRSKIEEAKIAADMLREVFEVRLRELARLEEQDRAYRRWNVEAEQLLDQAKRARDEARVLADDEELARRPGVDEELEALEARLADVQERSQDLIFRGADLAPWPLD